MAEKLTQAQIRFLSEILSEELDPEDLQQFEVFPREKATAQALARLGILELKVLEDDSGDPVLVCSPCVSPGDTAESLRARWGIPKIEN